MRTWQNQSSWPVECWNHMACQFKQAILTALIFGLINCFCLFSNSPAQTRSIPKTVTLKNGAQFEGETFYVTSVGGLDAQADGQKRIVVVDDGIRLVFFNRNQIARTGDAVNIQNETSIPIWQKTYLGDSAGFGHIESIGPFDENGHRTLTVRNAAGQSKVIQGITEITPRHCELQTLNIPRAIPGDDRRMRDWTMRVATSSIPIDVLRSVMRMQIKDYESPMEQLQIVELFVQAQKYQHALEELRLIQIKFPDIRDEIENRRNFVRQSYARFVIREIRMRLDSGQTNYALELADAFNKEGIAGEILAEFMDIRNGIRNKRKLVDQSRRDLGKMLSDTIQAKTIDDAQIEIVRRFQNELETELNEFNLTRLDSYQRLAGDDAMKIDRKIALAISGWLLGSNNAIDNLAIVQSLYPVRDIVMEYLTTDIQPRRARLLNELENYEGGDPQYLADLIENMKPPRGPDVSEHTGQQPIEFYVEIPGTKANPEPRKFQCLAQVPPQYNPYRKYPCILTLRAGVKTETQLNRWCGGYNDKLQVRTGPAMRHGYIVVAVDWKQQGQSAYTYSAREHAIVLKALKKSLQMFAIDSDRVFLHGHDIGATAAYDIGISHPEHWAGIIGIGGVIDRYPNNYSKNTHLGLPVYCVAGQKDRGSRDLSKRAWNDWCRTSRYLDCVVVLYEGRVNVSYGGGPTAETFQEEVPHILNWMAAQRRRLPDASGFKFDCKVLRPWDNYFWFWQLHDIPEKNVTRPEHWKHNKHNPLTISGELKANVPNRFILGPKKLGSGGTLWLSPEFVNFEDEIVISGRGDFSEFVSPSRAILLEDVRVRGDRQHPFWAKVDCKGKRWSVDGE